MSDHQGAIKGAMSREQAYGRWSVGWSSRGHQEVLKAQSMRNQEQAYGKWSVGWSGARQSSLMW